MPRPPRTQPTSAVTRSWGLAACALVVAAIAGRVDLALLAVPFVVHAGWAWWRRPVEAVEVETSPHAVEIAEGDSVPVQALAVDAPPSSMLSVQWPAVVGVVTDPKYGAAIGSADTPIEVSVEPDKWGRYRLERPGVQVLDESGSWLQSETGEAVTIKVRPAASTLQGGSGVTRPIGLTGAHISSERGDGTQIADIREYRSGDRLRRINWRVTSRTQKLHVTQTFTERDTDVLVVADTLYDLPDPAGVNSSLDATVRAIAAITQHYVGFGDRVAVADLGHRIGSVRTGTGPRQVRIVMERLSAASRDVAEHLTMRSVRSLRSGTLVFFCSPLLADKVLDELVRLRQLGAEMIVVDTMPEALGTTAAIGPHVPGNHLDEAWVIRRLQRETTLDQIESLGIPVTPWRGTGSLASVLVAMQAARSAPRKAVGR